MPNSDHGLRSHGVADKPDDFHGRLLHGTERREGQKGIASPDAIHDMTGEGWHLDKSLIRTITQAAIAATSDHRR